MNLESVTSLFATNVSGRQLHLGFIVAVALTIGPAVINPAWAQEDREGSRGDRFFGMLDRNQDGTLDTDEIEQISPRMRGFLENAGIDGSQPISREEFAERSARAMEQFGGGRGGGGFGRGRWGRGEGDEGNGEGEDRGRRDGDDGDDDRRSRRWGEWGRGEWGRDGEGEGSSRFDRRSRDERNSNGQSAADAKKVEKQRVTVDMPAEFISMDRDGDKQIGFYEWKLARRSELASFSVIDRNRDGFLTPWELANKDTAKPAESIAQTAPPAATDSANGGGSTNGFASGGGRRRSRFDNGNWNSGEQSVAAATAAATSGADSGQSSEALEKEAHSRFYLMDGNGDGSLTSDEWANSRKIRPMFENAGIDISQPMPEAAFIEHYKKLNANRGQ